LSIQNSILKKVEFEIKEIYGVKTTFVQNKKNLNHCHQMLFLGSKYAKSAFEAGGCAPDPKGGA